MYVYTTIYAYKVFICNVTLYNWSKVTRCMLAFIFYNISFLLLFLLLLSLFLFFVFNLLFSFLLFIIFFIINFYFLFVFCLTICLFTFSLLCLRSIFVGYITNKLTCHVKTVVAYYYLLLAIYTYMYVSMYINIIF